MSGWPPVRVLFALAGTTLLSVTPASLLLRRIGLR
jgi:hypothetical protein